MSTSTSRGGRTLISLILNTKVTFTTAINCTAWRRILNFLLCSISTAHADSHWLRTRYQGKLGKWQKAEPSVQERMSLWRSEHPNPGRNICKKAGRCRAWENKGLRCFQIFHVTRSVRSANISKHERLFAGFTVNCSRG